MMDQNKLLSILRQQGVDFFTGVPDSYLNGFCNSLLEHIPQDKHIIAANEGNAIAIASGYYFATGKIPLVYMQNSGMGNAMNPLLSLADSHVYGVPMLLLIGWRGEPGTDDHPQHIKQGEVTLKLLELWGIPYEIAAADRIEKQMACAVSEARENGKPVAIIGTKGMFAAVEKENITDKKYPLSREDAIEIILETLPDDAVYVATTGRATRELFFLREKRGEGHEHDFLNVGSMGHASSVALGLALGDSERLVVCLDGDAAALMHMGAFTMAGKIKSSNMLHVVLNNGAHESVGGQPSAGHIVDLTKIAEGAGYRTVGAVVETEEALVKALKKFEASKGPFFIDMRIHKGLKGKLPPLKVSYGNLIEEFQNELRK
ncbi:MAG: phosphonopyruvate decarboxylase [bacterium]|nr:phosphonopyruvate decarboxylase [bacterium]MCM1374640.1 phosphonopyruvate decarboxylase [Muribaculum sp.]